MKLSKSILVISDYHAPYNHPDAANFLRACALKYKPDTVVCIGDEVDNHAMSFHDHDADLPSAGDELVQAIKALQPLYKMFPNCIVVDSNHGSMVGRKRLAHGMPSAVIKPYRDILQAPKGWSWVEDITLFTPMGKVYFHHSKGINAKKNSQSMGCSFVQGHHHEQFELSYWSNPDALLFGMTVGCLVDRKSLALAYAKNNLKRQIIGCATIINGKPDLIPMLLNKTGRWTGKLL